MLGEAGVIAELLTGERCRVNGKVYTAVVTGPKLPVDGRQCVSTTHEFANQCDRDGRLINSVECFAEVIRSNLGFFLRIVRSDVDMLSRGDIPATVRHHTPCVIGDVGLVVRLFVDCVTCIHDSDGVSETLLGHRKTVRAIVIA